MSVTVRYYLFPEDAPPLRLSRRLVEGLTHGNDAMPQYANTRQKVLGAVVDNLDGKPHQIDRTYGAIWTFDSDGEIREGLQESLAEVMNSISATDSSATVVSISPRLSKKRHEEKFRWEPSKAHIDAVIRDIWPKAKADRLGEGKGISQKKPTLTSDGRRAIEKASAHFWEIPMELAKLKEPSLKGFVFEAKKRAKEEVEYAPLYGALAQMGENQLELAVRTRSGKGVWYAVVEVLHQREEFMETVRVIREKCEGRKAAVVAARRLLAENAHLFNENVSIDARVVTDLEWDVLAYGDDLE